MEQFLAALAAIAVFVGIVAAIGVGVFLIGLMTSSADEPKPT